MLKKEEKILIEGSIKIGIKLSRAQINKFSHYFDILNLWNKNTNLTSLKDHQDIIIKHFLDSLTCVKIIKNYIDYTTNKEKDITIIDIGTGAGFPGVPLKIIFPYLKLTLLDIQKKKAAFLKTLIEELRFSGVFIFTERAEKLGKMPEYRENYNIAISRAVAPLSILSEYSLPLVKQGGWFVAQKGRSYKKELECSLKVVKFLGGELLKLENVQLPFLNQERYILIIKKTKNTPRKYPRRAGLPQKRPLNFYNIFDKIYIFLLA